MKKKYFKRKAARVKSFFSRRKAKKNNAAGESMTSILLAGAAYGAVRAPIATAADSLLSKLPLPAQIADEVGMGVLSYFAYKKGSGFVKKMGKAGLYIESYRIADTFAAPMVKTAMAGILPTTAGNNSSGLFVN